MRPLAFVTFALATLVAPQGAFGTEPSSAEMISYCKRMLDSDATLSFLVKVRAATITLPRFALDETSRGQLAVELITVDRAGSDWLVFCQFDGHYPLTAKLFGNMADFCDCPISFADPRQLATLNRLASTPTP